MRVKTFRDAGLEAKWSKTRLGRPYLVARNPKRGRRWFVVDRAMLAQIEKHGVVQGFENATLLGDLFSLPVE